MPAELRRSRGGRRHSQISLQKRSTRENTVSVISNFCCFPAALVGAARGHSFYDAGQHVCLCFLFALRKQSKAKQPQKASGERKSNVTITPTIITMVAVFLVTSIKFACSAQVRALVLMAGTLSSCQGFDPADYDALATKTAQYAAKLLKKPDQCRMVTLCSHLFWAPEEVMQRPRSLGGLVLF